MNTKTFLKFSIFLTLFLAMSMSAWGLTCGATINTSTTLTQDYDCRGTGTDAFVINSADMELDCDSYKIIGDASYNGIFTNFQDRINITNCNINNSDFAINLRGTDTGKIYNCNFTNNNVGIRGVGNPSTLITIEDNIFNNSDTNIYAEYLNRSIIKKNKFESNTANGILFRISENVSVYNNDFFSSQNQTNNGIYATGLSRGDFNISNNNVTGWDYGIRIEENNSNTIVQNNIVKGVGLWGISVKSEKSVINNNNIYNTSWNAIFYAGKNNIIDSNYIENYYHHGIDTHGDGTHAKFTNITNNIITQTLQSNYWKKGDAGIYIVGANDTYCYNNTLKNLISDTYNTEFDDGGRGITIENNFTENNRIINNTFINISGYCLRIGDKNGTYQENTFKNCSYESIYYGDIIIRKNSATPALIVDSIFINNKRPDNTKVKISGTDEQAKPTFKNMKFEYIYTSQFSLPDGEINISCSSNSQNYSVTKGETWEFNKCIAGGVFPYDDLSISADTDLHTGKYYLDDSAGNGVFSIQDNGNLNCNGAEIVGNSTDSSKGIYFSTKNNVYINNCKITKYFTGISTRNGINTTIRNVETKQNIRSLDLDGCNDCFIYDSIFNNSGSSYNIFMFNVGNNIKINNVNTTSGTRCFSVEGTNTNVSIENSYIHHCGVGINIEDDSSDYIISNNDINYSLTNSIIIKNRANSGNISFNKIYNNSNTNSHLIDLTGQNNTVIYNNTINISGRNCIDMAGYNNKIYKNIVGICGHVGIDMQTDSKEDGGNNSVYSNTVFDDGILIRSQNNNKVYNNLMYANIAAEGNHSFCYDNYIYNNTFIKANYSIYAGGCKNTTWQDNNITDDLSGYEIRVQGFFLNEKNNPDTSRFINNIYNDKISNILIKSEHHNISINESSDKHSITLSNGQTFNISDTFRKQLRIENNTISTLAPMTAANPVLSGTADFTIDKPFSFTRLLANGVPFKEINTTTILSLDNSNGNNDQSKLQISGTGEAIMNLSNIQSKHDFIQVYKNSNFLEDITSDLYRLSSFSTWLFRGDDEPVDSGSSTGYQTTPTTTTTTTTVESEVFVNDTGVESYFNIIDELETTKESVYDSYKSSENVTGIKNKTSTIKEKLKTEYKENKPEIAKILFIGFAGIFIILLLYLFYQMKK